MARLHGLAKAELLEGFPKHLLIKGTIASVTCTQHIPKVSFVRLHTSGGLGMHLWEDRSCGIPIEVNRRIFTLHSFFGQCRQRLAHQPTCHSCDSFACCEGGRLCRRSGGGTLWCSPRRHHSSPSKWGSGAARRASCYVQLPVRSLSKWQQPARRVEVLLS